MRYRYEKLLKFHYKIVIAAVLIILIVFFSIRSIENAVRPNVDSLCKHYCNQIAVYTINSCINDVLTENEITYSDLSEIKYNESGEISSVNIDSVKVNQIQSEIVQAILNECKRNDDQNIEVPIGSISGFYLFNGHGPNIKIKIISKGNIKTELHSEFKDAGINQSCHRIYLDISVDMLAVFAGGEKKVTVNSNCILAETIIVGDVPDGILEM